MDKVAIYKEQTTSLINIIDSKNRVALAGFESSLTIAKAMEGTMINRLRSQDEKKTLTYIVFLISKLNESFALNPEKKLNSNQIYDVAVDLLDMFGYETIEDLVLMFKMVRKGELDVEAIHRIDIFTILNKWVPAYLNLKADAREKNHERIKNQVNQTQISLDDVKKTYEQLSIQHYINNLTYNMDRQMLDDTIETYARDERLKIYVPYLKKKRLSIT